MKKITKKLLSSLGKKIIIGIILLTFWINHHVVAGPMEKAEWVEKQLQQLSLEACIGQLFMVTVSPQQGEKHHAWVLELIEKYHIGGLLFLKGDPLQQVTLINHYQQKSTIPLMIAIDGEWGLGMRLAHTISYPKQMTLGAITNRQLIYQMGAEIGRQLKLIGVHINFAPVLDINTNPHNPGIGYRAFGDSKGIVANHGMAYIKGLQDNGIMAVAKHFPGLGEATKDSHHELPIILSDSTTIDEITLYPFKEAIAHHVGGIMVGHMYLPAYEPVAKRAASLSPAIVHDLLEDQLGFQGLIFTDALNMKAVSKYYQPGEVEVMALKAGNDVLLFSENIPKAIMTIKAAIEKGELDKAILFQKVKKILAAKYDMQLHHWLPLQQEELDERLNTPMALLLKQRLFEQAITVVANEDNFIPIRKLSKHKIASLSIIKQPNDDKKKTDALQTMIVNNPVTTFSQFLTKYAPISHFTLNRNDLDIGNLATLANELKNYTCVIVDVHHLKGNITNHFDLAPELIQFLIDLQDQNTKVVLVAFDSAYSLEVFKDIKILVSAFQEDEIAEQVAAQVLFGALPAVGNLPVTIPGAWEREWGIHTQPIQRLGYSIPEGVQMDSKQLQEMDTIIEQAISENIFPGCQVLVARKGKIVMEKAYGYHTYAKQQPVTNTTVYDIASITKVVGPLQAVMYLVDHQKIDIRKKVSFYLPELSVSNKKNITIKALLAHQAGLLDLPFYNNGLLMKKNNVLNKKLFSNSPSATYPYKIGNALYGSPLVKELIWDAYLKTPLSKKRFAKPHKYHYNDISFQILHKLIERICQQPLDVFLSHTFYRKLGLTTIGYHPSERIIFEQIAPTAEFDFFRNKPIQGVVHDPQAAVYGGVAGNAGIFSNAHDLAVISQMNLQGGTYGETYFLTAKTIQQFTKQAFKNNRRGLGWDKPERKSNNTSSYASQATYGHLGFTGTALWIDPNYELIFIFLSNRTYPNDKHNMLSKKNIRILLQDIVYKSLTDVTLDRPE